jgi:hypothetical protein
MASPNITYQTSMQSARNPTGVKQSTPDSAAFVNHPRFYRSLSPAPNAFHSPPITTDQTLAQALRGHPDPHSGPPPRLLC